MFCQQGALEGHQKSKGEVEWDCLYQHHFHQDPLPSIDRVSLHPPLPDSLLEVSAHSKSFPWADRLDNTSLFPSFPQPCELLPLPEVLTLVTSMVFFLFSALSHMCALLSMLSSLRWHIKWTFVLFCFPNVYPSLRKCPRLTFQSPTFFRMIRTPSW